MAVCFVTEQVSKMLELEMLDGLFTLTGMALAVCGLVLAILYTVLDRKAGRK